MSQVRVVTDSAADLPTAVAERLGISIVPLSVRFGSQSYLSGVELSTDEFWRQLEASEEGPATAAPSAGDFQQTFERLIAEGATGIVSIHLSSKLSATYQSATVAAKEFADTPIEVIDTLAVSAGTGIVSVIAAERAAAGANATDIAAEVSALCPRIRLYGAIETLEYLRRGGRIGGAQALLGSMLKVKPIISLKDGEVEPVSRVRTRAKALQHLTELAGAHANGVERVVVVTAQAPDTDELVDMMTTATGTAPEVWEFGPVVGTHAGPGLIGIAFLVKD